MFFSLISLISLCSLSAQQQPTFKSGVDLVRFDVRIVDEAGRPITDIKPDEIEIREGGTLLPVVLFQRITEPAESYVDAALRAVTAEVSSNEAFPRGHLYILIFDQQHITPGNEQRARVAAEQFIRRRVRPSDRVALFAIPGPGPQVGFTADKLRAIRELDSIRGSYERFVSSPLGRMTAYEAHRVVQGDERADQRLDGAHGHRGRDRRRRRARGRRRLTIRPSRAACSRRTPARSSIRRTARRGSSSSGSLTSLPASATSRGARRSYCSPRGSSRITSRASSRPSPRRRRRATAWSRPSTSISAASASATPMRQRRRWRRKFRRASRRWRRWRWKPTA